MVQLQASDNWEWYGEHNNVQKQTDDTENNNSIGGQLASGHFGQLRRGPSRSRPWHTKGDPDANAAKIIACSQNQKNVASNPNPADTAENSNVKRQNASFGSPCRACTYKSRCKLLLHVIVV